MAKYEVFLAASAERELNKLPHRLIQRIVARLEKLESDPRPSGCKKLHGGEREWRVRIGDYRVVYLIDDEQLQVEITRVRHRSAVYER